MMWITVGYIKYSYSQSKVDTYYDNHIIIAVVSFHPIRAKLSIIRSRIYIHAV